MNNRYIIDLLEEMKRNCLNGNNYYDPKRNDKVEALNYAIFCVERQQPTVDAEDEAYAAALRRPLQKPLTLEEACKSEEPCVYFEFGRSGFAPIKAALITKKQDENGYEVVILGGAKPIPFFANMYGSVLRCWATKPSDEERSAAQWE